MCLLLTVYLEVCKCDEVKSKVQLHSLDHSSFRSRKESFKNLKLGPDEENKKDKSLVDYIYKIEGKETLKELT